MVGTSHRFEQILFGPRIGVNVQFIIFFKEGSEQMFAKQNGMGIGVNRGGGL